MAAALGGPTLKNADFWRLLARASEEARQGPLDIAMACSAWEEFRKHAIEEKWFPAFGPEVAALYLHMADLWTRIPDEEIAFVRGGSPAGSRDINIITPASLRTSANS